MYVLVILLRRNWFGIIYQVLTEVVGGPDRALIQCTVVVWYPKKFAFYLILY